MSGVQSAFKALGRLSAISVTPGAGVEVRMCSYFETGVLDMARLLAKERETGVVWKRRWTRAVQLRERGPKVTEAERKANDMFKA